MKALFFLLLLFVVVQSFIGGPGARGDSAGFGGQGVSARTGADSGLRPRLSDYSFFEGKMAELRPGKGFAVYTPGSALFTDYAEKLRFRSEDGKVFVKTFYYNTAEGRRIIETRVLLLVDGVWVAGTYVWNTEQTEAFLSTRRSTVEVRTREGRLIRYGVPSKGDCSTCHGVGGVVMPIGPGLADVPDWRDSSRALGVRVRAYLAANCAHCHNPDGYCAKAKIDFRFSNSNDFIGEKVLVKAAKFMRQGRMPQLGTSVVHAEGLALIESFLNHQNK